MSNGAGADYELPREIVFEILCRLPVKSLCRFRCVSKVWNSIIADPLFVEAQYAYSRSRPRLLIFTVISWILVGGVEFHSTDYPQQMNDSTQTLSDHGGTGGRVKMISHAVNGLYCLDIRDSLRIMNPITGESFDLKTTEAEAALNPRLNCVTRQLGFDPVEKKHKVLDIWKDISTGRVHNRLYYLEEEEEDNRGRTLNNYPTALRNRAVSKDAICIDGVMFYASGNYLVAFHVRSETHQVIPLPEGAPNPAPVEFAGHVAVVNRHKIFTADRNRIDLWILEDMDDHAWRRKTCEIPWREGRDGAFRIEGGNSGELMLVPIHSWMPFFFFIYNVESDSLRRIELEGLCERASEQNQGRTRINFYVESLYSIKRTNV